MNRLSGLDALRAISALAVMGFHVSVASGVALVPLDGVLAHGYRGVVVFFALSGFVVARQWLIGNRGLGAYFALRAARIVPAYLVALVGVSVMTGDAQLLRHPIEYLTFTQNFDPSLLAQGALAPTWTLQLEVEFYLLLPVLMVALSGLLPRLAIGGILLIIGLVITSLILHLGFSVSPDEWARTSGRLSLPAMLWAFLPGVALAWALDRSARAQSSLARRPIAVFALALVAYGWLGSSLSPLASVTESAALVSGVVLLIPSLSTPRTSAASWTQYLERPLSWFGRVVSYPFYLWHNGLILVLVGAGIGGWQCAALTLLLGTLVGATSWLLVESPCLARVRGAVGAAARNGGSGDRAAEVRHAGVSPQVAP